MTRRIRQIVLGTLISCSTWTGVAATGCAVEMDDACVLAGACDVTLEAVQSFELKQVAIY